MTMPYSSPPQWSSPESGDVGNVKLLSTFHFVMAGITGLFACFPIIHVVIGVMIVSGKVTSGTTFVFTSSTAAGNSVATSMPATNTGNTVNTRNTLNTGTSVQPGAAVGYMFIAMGGLFILMGWAMAVLMLLAGLRLRKLRSRVFCMVVAGLECVLFPFGTVLGVFTLIVLSKDSVKAMFEGRRSVLPMSVG